jgi:hypothetical protein
VCPIHQKDTPTGPHGVGQGEVSVAYGVHRKPGKRVAAVENECSRTRHWLFLSAL